MTADYRRWLSELSEAFWVLPAAMVIGGVLLAMVLVSIDVRGILPHGTLTSSWIYNGGATGARTLLGAVASSAIGVAGTVFSITIAALSLAAGQMGPRLLRNFTRDRGNQVTLGAFLGTFSYALMVLRTVRSPDEGEFVPHMSLTIAIILSFGCVGTLVYFVGHMASRINVDTVIDLVSQDVRDSLTRLTTDSAQAEPLPTSFWVAAAPVIDTRQGYLQRLDAQGLSHWARENGTHILLLVKPGGFVFPGSAIAMIQPVVDGAEHALRNATALSSQRISSEDLEYSVRQLVEVAVRALSPGINDPHTAIGVLDRLGAALCELASRALLTGVYAIDGDVALVVPAVDYDGLADAMFHMIRQNARGSSAVLIRMVDVLTAVAGCERDRRRVATLSRHVRLIVDDARRDVANPADLADLEARTESFDQGTMKFGLATAPDATGQPVAALHQSEHVCRLTR